SRLVQPVSPRIAAAIITALASLNMLAPPSPHPSPLRARGRVDAPQSAPTMPSIVEMGNIARDGCGPLPQGGDTSDPAAFSRAMKPAAAPLALAAALALGGCAVVPPAGPSVLVMPGPGKSFPQFQAEDTTCRHAAAQWVSGEAAQASDAANGNAVLGTLFGAAIGALYGAAAGNPGAGAAIGAGPGCCSAAAPAPAPRPLRRPAS